MLSDNLSRANFFGNPAKGLETQVRACTHIDIQSTEVKKEPAHAEIKLAQVGEAHTSEKGNSHTRENMAYEGSNPEQLSESYHCLLFG